MWVCLSLCTQLEVTFVCSLGVKCIKWEEFDSAFAEPRDFVGYFELHWREWRMCALWKWHNFTLRFQNVYNFFLINIKKIKKFRISLSLFCPSPPFIDFHFCGGTMTMPQFPSYIKKIYSHPRVPISCGNAISITIMRKKLGLFLNQEETDAYVLFQFYVVRL